MAGEIAQILKEEIARKGPISVARYMEVALADPQHGYYMSRDPLGARGDFTTAPEVSQMFGEMIAAWVVDLWTKMGSPEDVILLECGPGRGTLMADLLRAASGRPTFMSAAKIYLMEISPVLKAAQEKALEGHKVKWISGLEDVPDHAPVIVIGNEFLDALAFHQLQKRNGKWCERVVKVEADGFAFDLADAPAELLPFIAADIAEFDEGDIVEVSPERAGFVALLAERFKGQGGSALWIDYGHSAHGKGDSFQALKDHQYIDVLLQVGEADLTSHVNFAALSDAALACGLEVYGPAEQGAFLRALGIEVRAQNLMMGKDGETQEQIKKDLHRLTHSDQMGSLFKVLCMGAFDEPQSGQSIIPAGF